MRAGSASVAVARPRAFTYTPVPTPTSGPSVPRAVAVLTVRRWRIRRVFGICLRTGTANCELPIASCEHVGIHGNSMLSTTIGREPERRTQITYIPAIPSSRYICIHVTISIRILASYRPSRRRFDIGESQSDLKVQLLRSQQPPFPCNLTTYTARCADVPAFPRRLTPSRWLAGWRPPRPPHGNIVPTYLYHQAGGRGEAPGPGTRSAGPSGGGRRSRRRRR